MIVEEFLGSRRVAFTRIVHTETHGTKQLARLLHLQPEDVVKTVLLKHQEGFVVALLPAACEIDLEKVKQVLDRTDISLASKDEIADHYADCERGIVLPFGSWYGMTTLVDRSLLAAGKDIIFEGNTHREAIRMGYSDFQELEQPRIVDIAVKGCREEKMAKHPHP